MGEKPGVGLMFTVFCDYLSINRHLGVFIITDTTQIILRTRFMDN